MCTAAIYFLYDMCIAMTLGGVCGRVSEYCHICEIVWARMSVRMSVHKSIHIAVHTLTCASPYACMFIA